MVVFMKEYHLKGKKYELLNKEGMFEDEENVVEIKIKPNSHYTFIVKFVDGIDQELLNHF